MYCEGFLSFLVHEERAVDAVHVVQPDDDIVQHGVAHHHLGLGVPFGRPVLRESFGEPERRKAVLRFPVVDEDAADLAVHEHVDELVADHVPELGGGAVGRDDDAAFEEFEEPADAFGDEPAGGVGLLEVEVGAVEDQRDACVEGVVELRFEEL